MALPFPVRPRYDRARFFVSPANSAAVALIDSWPRWPSHAAALRGPQGSGKTHLLNMWAARSGARILDGSQLALSWANDLPDGFCAGIDDADLAAPRSEGAEALFHLLNRAHQEGGSILLTGQAHPALWRTDLPDLRTRLGAVTVADIGLPDDTLMAAVLTKLFTDHQLSAPPELIGFIVARMERSIAAASRLAEAMDRATIGTGRTLSYELAERLITADAHD